MNDMLGRTDRMRYLAEHGQEPGFGKVIVDAETQALLGVHLVDGAHRRGVPHHPSHGV